MDEDWRVSFIQRDGTPTGSRTWDTWTAMCKGLLRMKSSHIRVAKAERINRKQK